MSAREFRVLVTGSRDWTDRDTIWRALLDHAWEQPRRPITVVHGDAPGADTIAHNVAREMAWQVERHPADWATLGRSAGPKRNRHMVNLGADVCLAFIRHGSRGATGCALLAEKACIPTYRYREDT